MIQDAMSCKCSYIGESIGKVWRLMVASRCWMEIA